MSRQNHTQLADNSTELPTTSNPALLAETAHRYRYFRCRCNGRDDTVYVHQLCAIAAGHDPDDVFSGHYDVHHKPLSDVFDLETHVPALPLDLGDDRLPPIDTPEAVTLEPRNEHRARTLEWGDSR